MTFIKHSFTKHLNAMFFIVAIYICKRNSHCHTEHFWQMSFVIELIFTLELKSIGFRRTLWTGFFAKSTQWFSLVIYSVGSGHTYVHCLFSKSLHLLWRIILVTWMLSNVNKVVNSIYLPYQSTTRSKQLQLKIMITFMYNGGIATFNILLLQPVELKNSVKIL